MPLKNQTIFGSTGDNAASAAEFAEALGKQGVKSSVEANADGSVSVFYEHDDALGLQALIIAIEEKHPAKAKAAVKEEPKPAARSSR